MGSFGHNNLYKCKGGFIFFEMGKLVLQDGSVYEGVSFGAEKSKAGEVVFCTGMVGYPEALTDPSYRGQILVFTYPLMGNYGVPAGEGLEGAFESGQVQVAGVVVQDYCRDFSHWQAVKSFGAWLQEQGVPAIAGIDTRSLTKKLREKGTMLGKLVIDQDLELFDPNAINIVKEVSISQPVTYGAGNKKVVLVDTGSKWNILRCLLKRNLMVIQVPWDYDFSQLDYDGLFLSNGPGDPKQCTATIEHLKKALQENKPIFGICLGNQLLALAAGGDTYKLKYGHRSQNQPCINLQTGRCYITTQNHGFAVDEKSLPQDWVPWFRNANDNTNEGVRHKTKPFFSTQFHIEHSPGPMDTEYLLDEWVKLL